MGNFFEVAFPDVELNPGGDTQVCCPFPHYTFNGEKYYETNPSAGVNLVKNVFHCFQCNAKYSEVGFIAQYMNIDYASATRIKHIINNTKENIHDWELSHQLLLNNKELMKKLTGELNIPIETVKQLKLGTENNGISFPIFLYGQLLDVRTYNPKGQPKVVSRKGSKTGLIAPYDLWLNDPSSTLICAGEKDMAIARAMGFNAITITGGERRIPELFLSLFKDRKVYIVYDNDETGFEGSRQLAMHVRKHTNEVKIIDLSDVCRKKGEDLWDYFVRYKKTKEDFIEKTKATPWFSDEEYEEQRNKEYPIMSLMEASQPENIKKLVRSDIQVIATFETQYYTPSSITAVKTNTNDPQKEVMMLGETRSWYLNDTNIKDILYLMDSGLREDAIFKNKKEKLLGIPNKEPFVDIKEESRETVYKCALTDAVDSLNIEIEKAEYVAYSLNQKLRTGAKYRVTYMLVPHPYDGQKLTMIIVDVEDVNDSVDNFTIDKNKIKLLQQFQVAGSLVDKINELTERAKGIIGEDRNNTLVQLIDFWYNTPLKMKVGNREMRAYLDMLIIGESRTGKSSTFEALQRTYKLGSRVDFGGSNATKAGIIGGTTQVGGTHKTRAGLLPRNHRNAVCFEELGRASVDIIKELTEARSSGEIKLQRVDGDLHLPAMVRMLSLTNTKETEGSPRSLMSYPHGLSIITDLIPSAADIARYDLIAIIYDQGAKVIDPFYEPMQPFSEESYRTRIRWIWSRKPEQIIITKEIYQYLVIACNKLNSVYDTHIKIFGVEAWQKILRLAVSIAGYVVSTDENYETIIVTKDHIDYAVRLFVNLYDNEHFRFRQYVEEQKQFSTIDEEGIAALQSLYTKNPTILIHLETNSSTTARTVQTLSGMSSDDFNAFMNRLTNALFVKYEGYNIVPTERFRIGMTQINRKTRIDPIGVRTYGL